MGDCTALKLAVNAAMTAAPPESMPLLAAAIEAMADSTRRELVVATSSADGSLIEVSVTDSGPGLSIGIAEDLFKPFVTTKSDGMGVGLAICQTIVAAHGGKIWASTNPNGGTVFSFTLERSEPEDPNAS